MLHAKGLQKRLSQVDSSNECTSSIEVYSHIVHRTTDFVNVCDHSNSRAPIPILVYLLNSINDLSES